MEHHIHEQYFLRLLEDGRTPAGISSSDSVAASSRRQSRASQEGSRSLIKPTTESSLLEEKFEAIKTRKLKIKLQLSLCLLESESGEYADVLHSHTAAFNYCRDAVNCVLDLIYDSYTLCFHHLLKTDKVSKMTKAWKLKKKKELQDLEEAEQNHIEESLNIYVINAANILRYIIETLKEHGFENSERQKVIDLMKAMANGYTEEIENWFKPSVDHMRGEKDGEFRESGNTIDLSLLFEYLGEENYLLHTSIIHFLQHRFLSIDDPLFSPTSFNEQISPEVLLEKIAYLVVCLYALSTESRYMHSSSVSEEKKDAIIHKETTELTPRFQNFNLLEKNIDVNEVEFRKSRMAKLRMKEKQINQEITES